MPSINAESVANEVLAKVRSGKKVNMQEIQKAHGYSASSAIAMKATRTVAYKKVMEPIVQRLEKLREKALAALDKKDLDLEDTRVLKELMDSYTKQIQLLSGKATENVATSVTIVSYQDTILDTVNDVSSRTSTVGVPLVTDSDALTDQEEML